MLIDASRLIERGTMWFLRSRRLSDDMAATIAQFSPRVEALQSRLAQLLDPGDRARIDSEVGVYAESGVPQSLAERVVVLDTLYSTLDIVEVADATQRPVELVAEIYFNVSTRLGVPWLRGKIMALTDDHHWQKLAKGAMLDDLSGLQRTVSSEVLTGGRDIPTAAALIAAWQDRNRRAIDRLVQLLAELKAAMSVDAAMLSVALRELRSLG
jgi:glutamate dehydrogenase